MKLHNKAGELRQISHISQKSFQCNRYGFLLTFAKGLVAPKQAICKSSAKRRHGFQPVWCFADRQGPAFKQNKSPAAHHRLRNDPVTSWLISSPMPGHGRQMGMFGHSHAWRNRGARVGIGRFGPAAVVSAATLDRSETSGLIEEIRRTVRAFSRHPCPRAAWRKMAGCRAPARRRTGAAGAMRRRSRTFACLRRRFDSRHRGQCESPRGRARLGEINRAINLAIRPMSDLAQYVRSTSELAALDVRYPAPAIAKTTRSQSSSPCATPASQRTICGSSSCGYHPGRGSRRCRGPKLDGHWLMLDNRRMANGRGRQRQELSADFCHRIKPVSCSMPIRAAGGGARRGFSPSAPLKSGGPARL